MFAVNGVGIGEIVDDPMMGLAVGAAKGTTMFRSDNFFEELNCVNTSPWTYEVIKVGLENRKFKEELKKVEATRKRVLEKKAGGGGGDGKRKRTRSTEKSSKKCSGCGKKGLVLTKSKCVSCTRGK